MENDEDLKKIFNVTLTPFIDLEIDGITGVGGTGSFQLLNQAIDPPSALNKWGQSRLK